MELLLGLERSAPRGLRAMRVKRTGIVALSGAQGKADLCRGQKKGADCSAPELPPWGEGGLLDFIFPGSSQGRFKELALSDRSGAQP